MQVIMKVSNYFITRKIFYSFFNDHFRLLLTFAESNAFHSIANVMLPYVPYDQLNLPEGDGVLV